MEDSTRSITNYNINLFLKLSQNKRYFYINKHKTIKGGEKLYE